MFRSGFTSTSSYRAASKADRLLRAAVTAFCANPRPTRREITQFDDLAEPLLGAASEETQRFMAATLSRSPYAPPALVRRLAALPAEISAPLLMRSPVLKPIDLLMLIASHGLDHARAIACRAELDERIVQIIHSLEVAGSRLAPAPAPDSLDETRDRLRGMMQPAPPTLTCHSPAISSPNPATEMHWHDKTGIYPRLRAAALTGTIALFSTELADALAIEPAQARAIAEDEDTTCFIVALRALPLSEEEAFLIMQCMRPVSDRHAIAAILNAWQALSQIRAMHVVTGWRKTVSDSSSKLRAS